MNQQKLLAFPARIAQAHRYYWSISKTDRIELGIRTDMDDRGYLGQLVLGTAQDVLLCSLAGQYPPRGLYAGNRDAWKIGDLGDAIKWLETELSELERRLSSPAAVAARCKREQRAYN